MSVTRFLDPVKMGTVETLNRRRAGGGEGAGDEVETKAFCCVEAGPSLVHGLANADIFAYRRSRRETSTWKATYLFLRRVAAMVGCVRT